MAKVLSGGRGGSQRGRKYPVAEGGKKPLHQGLPQFLREGFFGLEGFDQLIKAIIFLFIGGGINLLQEFHL